MSDPNTPPEDASAEAETAPLSAAGDPPAADSATTDSTATSGFDSYGASTADATSAEPPPPTPPPTANPAPYGGPGQVGPAGEIRSTGKCILLTIVTLGFYTWYWWYKVHKEMKDHSGTGVGGGLALLFAIVFSLVNAFLTPNEVGGLYSRRGQQAPVSAVWGLWWLLPLVGPIIWFVKTNGALNDYWASMGVPRP